MKANRKFLHGDDEAVSPVIAVILMVAITVVLAATVYVWVSGFGSNSNSSPAHTMSITSAGALVAGPDGADADTLPDYYYKTYTVSSADSSLTWADMRLTVAGAIFTFKDATTTNPADCVVDATPFSGLDNGGWQACSAGTARASTAAVQAGDLIVIKQAADMSNADLLILDIEANSVMVTLKVR